MTKTVGWGTCGVEGSAGQEPLYLVSLPIVEMIFVQKSGASAYYVICRVEETKESDLPTAKAVSLFSLSCSLNL
jgi:hypothetical protein